MLRYRIGTIQPSFNVRCKSSIPNDYFKHSSKIDAVPKNKSIIKNFDPVKAFQHLQNNNINSNHNNVAFKKPSKKVLMELPSRPQTPSVKNDSIQFNDNQKHPNKLHVNINPQIDYPNPIQYTSFLDSILLSIKNWNNLLYNPIPKPLVGADVLTKLPNKKDTEFKVLNSKISEIPLISNEKSVKAINHNVNYAIDHFIQEYLTKIRNSEIYSTLIIPELNKDFGTTLNQKDLIHLNPILIKSMVNLNNGIDINIPLSDNTNTVISSHSIYNYDKNLMDLNCVELDTQNIIPIKNNTIDREIKLIPAKNYKLSFTNKLNWWNPLIWFINILGDNKSNLNKNKFTTSSIENNNNNNKNVKVIDVSKERGFEIEETLPKNENDIINILPKGYNLKLITQESSKDTFHKKNKSLNRSVITLFESQRSQDSLNIWAWRALITIGQPTLFGLWLMNIIPYFWIPLLFSSISISMFLSQTNEVVRMMKYLDDTNLENGTLLFERRNMFKPGVTLLEVPMRNIHYNPGLTRTWIVVKNKDFDISKLSLIKRIWYYHFSYDCIKINFVKTKLYNNTNIGILFDLIKERTPYETIYSRLHDLIRKFTPIHQSWIINFDDIKWIYKKPLAINQYLLLKEARLNRLNKFINSQTPFPWRPRPIDSIKNTV